MPWSDQQVHHDPAQNALTWVKLAKMLTHICRYAQRHNLKSIESLESRENHTAIELERDMEFQSATTKRTPTVVVLRRDFKPQLSPDEAPLGGNEVSHMLR